MPEPTVHTRRQQLAASVTRALRLPIETQPSGHHGLNEWTTGCSEELLGTPQPRYKIRSTRPGIHCSAMSIGCCIAVAGADSARQSHLRRQTNSQRAPRDGALTSSPPTQLDLATPVKIDKSVGVCQRSPVSVTARAVTSHAHELMNTSGLRRP